MRLVITGMEPNPSGVEAGLSQDPGGSLRKNAGNCRTRDVSETNPSSPLRAGWGSLELELPPPHSCRNPLWACLTGENAQRGDRKGWQGKGFRSLCTAGSAEP